MRIIEDIEDYAIVRFEKCKWFWGSILWIMYFPDYFRYLFAKADNPRWCHDNILIDFFCRLKCRIRHHPSGSIYYNPGGYEPDGRCKECGDEIE